MTSTDGRLAVGTPAGLASDVKQNPEGAVYTVLWSPDSKWFITQTRSKAVRLWDAEGTEQVALAPSSSSYAPNTIVDWRPDSSEIAFCIGHAHAVGIWNVTDRQSRQLTLPATMTPLKVKWLPSLGHLAVNVELDSPRSLENDVRFFGRQFVRLDPTQADQPIVATGPLIPFKHSIRRQICFSSDGKQLLVTTGTQLIILHRDGRLDRQLALEREARRQVEWRTDNSIYFQDRTTQAVFRWDPEEQQTTTLPGTFEGHSRWSVHPNQPIHLFGTSDGRVILRREDGTESPPIAAHNGYVKQVTWNRDGTQFATSGSDGWLKVWSLAGEIIASHTTTNVELRSVVWHPTENLLAASGNNHDLFWWDIDKNALTKRQGANIIGGYEYVAWSPDGRTLAMPEGFRVQLWNADSTPGPVVAPTYAKIQGVTWSPDGKTLAVFDAGKTVSLWNTSDWSLDRYILLFEGDQTITIAGDGTILHGDADLIENELRYVALTPTGKRVLMKPSEFGARLPTATK